MVSFLMRRILITIPTILFVIILSFVLIRLAPGGPFDTEVALEPEVRENLYKAYNMDKSFLEQFFIYVGNVLKGDLGPSMIYKDFSVNELLATSLPVSADLGLKSVLFAVIVGGSLGIWAALNQNKPADYGVMTVAMTGIVIPNFVMAPILTLIFGIYLKELPGIGQHLGLPISGWGGLEYQILPIIALALPQVAIISRLTRASMIEAMRSSFIRSAQLRGIPQRRVIFRHAVPAALLPVVSYLGPAIASVATGSLVIEQVFDLPGIGRYFAQGAINRDYPVVMGVVIVFATAIIFLNLIVDVIYSFLDPKVRLS